MAAIGSSTTAGYITTTADSCWFGRFTNYYKCQLGVMDSAFNYGVPGDDVYNGMPTGYVPPSGRPAPSAATNISKAIIALHTMANPNDGVIIVNYPSNEYDIFTIAEIMNCLQLIYDSASKAGYRCFITTTQPRNDVVFGNSSIKRKLADIKDSTINRFGVAKTINFWDGMFNPADTTILPIYSAGDKIHFNNEGHRVLFERIMAKNVFNLPVWYAAPTGALNRLTSWGSNTNGTGSHPANFTTDNQVFIVVSNLAPTIDADWTIIGKNVRLIIGDGWKPVIFKIPVGYKINLTGPSGTLVNCQ